MSQLFVVRHGNTFAPDEQPRRIGARTDLPLVASGIQQAERLAAWFDANGIRFARVLSGSLSRTRDTARIIASRMADTPAIEPAEWLNEIDHGPDENLVEPAVLARLGRAALHAWDHCGIPPPDWNVDGPARIECWQRLFRQVSPGATLLVTSNGAARFALLASGAEPNQPMKLRTGAFGEIEAGGDSVRLLSWDVRPDDQR